MRKILYTRHDGGVSICTPSANCIRWMSAGGRWADYERGYVEKQIERQIADGVDERHAVRFARAMAFGGLTTSEALEAIKDKSCAQFGTAHELIYDSDLPDRWFRDAWRRSHNGGPVTIDLSAAKRVHFSKLRALVNRENSRRMGDLDLFAEPVKPDWPQIAWNIRKATDPEDVRLIWIDGVPRPGLWGDA